MTHWSYGIRLLVGSLVAVLLSSPLAAAEDDYQLDLYDGVGSPGSIGANIVRDAVYLNQFAVLPGKEVITSVNILWGRFSVDGTPITVIVWNDPNNDGNPSDATVLTAVDTEVVDSDTNLLTTYPVGAVLVGKPGDSFFIGVKTFGRGASVGLSGPPSPRAFHYRSGSGGVCGPDNLSSCNFAFTNQNPWIIRATAASFILTSGPVPVPALSISGLIFLCIVLLAVIARRWSRRGPYL